ncbi:MAG: hypothetical protein QM727_11790 [Niabella sp.]
MKIRLLIITFILTTGNLFAQKLYVWCPKEQIATPRQGFLEKDTIDLVIFDGRILTPKSKVECTSDETINRLTDFIKRTYPSTTINILNTNQYYKDPAKNRITVKIGISAYHAAFGADVKVGIGSVGGNFSYGVFPEGKWNAVTAYAVKIYDYRNNNEIKKVKDILKTASRPNTGGYITAKNILNSSYIEANQEVLFFIDETLMK